MNYSNGFEDVEVELVRVSHSYPFQMFWDWFKETWVTLHGMKFDPSRREHMHACIDVLNRHALPTPMEVLAFEVRITGLSRVALAQITRGRVGHCYNVLSQMPAKVVHKATIPRSLMEDPELREEAIALQEAATKLYDKAYDRGIPPQDCRYMTLHGQQTSLMWSVNLAALLGWFSRRCENGLTDELNIVGRKLRRELMKKYLDEDGNDIVEGSGWSFIIEKLDCIGADREMCVNNDRVFGNTGRHRSAGEWVPSAVNDEAPSDYRFDKSAFYYELMNMSDDLLFPGEREMIDDWQTIGFEGRLKKINEESK